MSTQEKPAERKARFPHSLLAVVLPICTFIISTLVIAAPVNSIRTKELNSLIASRQFQKAQLLAQKLLKLYPDDAEIRLAYAILLRNSGKASLSLKEFEKVRVLNPRLIQPLIALSELHRENLDLDKSLKVARLATTISPQSEEARFALILTLIQSDFINEAEEQMSHLLNLHKGKPNENMYLIAYQLKIKKGDYKEAKKYLEEVIALKPNSIRLQIDLSELMENSGNHIGANECLEKVLALDPNLSDARLRLARNLEFFFQDYNEAITQYKQVLELEPNSISALTGIERCRAKKNNIALRLKLALRAASERFHRWLTQFHT